MREASQVSDTLQQLTKMPRAQLNQLWEQSFGKQPVKKIRPEIMRLVLAYRVQELAFGGLSSETKRELQRSSAALRPGSRSAEEASSRFKQGTRIIREWGGKTHEVQICAEGYRYNGNIYKSLSPIATEITGTRWSGPAFFGTKRREPAA